MSAFEASTYYSTLTLPSWAPEPSVFGLVWTPLYVIIALSFSYVFYQAYRGAIPGSVVVPFLLNLVLNLAFQPTQLLVRNLVLDCLIMVLVVLTLVWALRASWKIPRIQWVALANLPYLAWGLFATVLQFTITYLTLTS